MIKTFEEAMEAAASMCGGQAEYYNLESLTNDIYKKEGDRYVMRLDTEDAMEFYEWINQCLDRNDTRRN